MPAGPSLIENIWTELDRVTKAIMDQRPRFKNNEMTPDELEGYFKLQGQAQGLAISIQIISTPHFEDVTAVSKWSLKRYHMNAGRIDFMDTPGCKGYNPMPPPTRELGKQPKRSSPATAIKTGKFKALSDEDRQHLINMHQKGLPAGAIQGMLKITPEQYDYEVSKVSG